MIKRSAKAIYVLELAKENIRDGLYDKNVIENKSVTECLLDSLHDIEKAQRNICLNLNDELRLKDYICKEE